MVGLRSAGTRAVVGAEMHSASAVALARLGGDPTGFRARQLTEGMAVGADLTLTMTREHRRQVLARAPRAMSRTFTLREAAGLLEIVGPEAEVSGAGPEERVRVLVKAMAAARARRPGSADDDIRDPIGHPDDVHAAVGQAIVDTLLPLLDRVAAALTPEGTGTPAGRGPS
jgi:protein-tyrosine-phosphatase